jgi:hypothetical protein
MKKKLKKENEKKNEKNEKRKEKSSTLLRVHLKISICKKWFFFFIFTLLMFRKTNKTTFNKFVLLPRNLVTS